jgi:hypothetical protein
MSLDFKFSCVPPRASLDDRSRRVIRGFALQLCVSSFLVLGPCIFGMRPWDGAAQLLALIFSLNGLIKFFIAASKRDRLFGPSLNLWDAAIAFNGCAALLHAVMHQLALLMPSIAELAEWFTDAALAAAPTAYVPRRPASQAVAQVSAPVRSPGRPAPRRWRSADLHGPADYRKWVGHFSPLRVAYR